MKREIKHINISYPIKPIEIKKWLDHYSGLKEGDEKPKININLTPQLNEAEYEDAKETILNLIGEENIKHFWVKISEYGWNLYYDFNYWKP